jgi:hypothetical protein
MKRNCWLAAPLPVFWINAAPGCVEAFAMSMARPECRDSMEYQRVVSMAAWAGGAAKKTAVRASAAATARPERRLRRRVDMGTPDRAVRDARGRAAPATEAFINLHI